ncbi:hypothetical protein JTE90_027723 [Oedothorax gibbosus]|uniref:Uncharacterized protein n=1 Tax=Oedothorax gibbosus TaxID=931172 RepID=A0AAV6UVU0_9ARAC|nr:hypothetical protein JTE90_027723 [Oedothorax gibbosus]
MVCFVQSFTVSVSVVLQRGQSLTRQVDGEIQSFPWETKLACDGGESITGEGLQFMSRVAGQAVECYNVLVCPCHDFCVALFSFWALPELSF